MATTSTPDRGNTSGTDTHIKDSDVEMPSRGTKSSEETVHGRSSYEKQTEAGLKPSAGGVKQEADGVTSDPDASDEYPHGGRLVIIMASLGMAVFLVALDQVSQAKKVAG